MFVIASERTQLSGVANQVLSQYHMRYRASVQLTETVFPTKVYGTWVLPAGRYTALLIKLGKADGHNWWCVLYPSLCFIDMTNGVAVPERAATAGTTQRHQHRRDRVSWRAPQFVYQIARLFHGF